MTETFIVNPQLTDTEINDAIYMRTEMGAAITKLVAINLDHQHVEDCDKMITNAIWAIEHFITEVKQLSHYRIRQTS